ncbi:MAG TPA: NAD(P)-binding domain-containing protein [Streptosporangiaceae bacterium]|nr:NAD(P)-binding domain-containing protein [Streptosporangiaceae bacterium]
MPTHIEVLVIGAGQAGLALSWQLSQRGVEHLVLEQGRTGQAWRSRRWDSFRLVTPNWFIRLPGQPAGLTPGWPDAFMSAVEMASALGRYAAAVRAPVKTGVRVVSLRYADPGYLVRAEEGSGQSVIEFRALNVVAATGAYQRPHLPPGCTEPGLGIAVVPSDAYRNPAQLPSGGVLVVGSGQSGVQIADDLIRAGRRVFLSAGGCGWVPRRYRGRDIACWLVEMGLLERTVDTLPAPAARLACFPQVSGARGGCDLNIHTLAATGVIIHGRVLGLSEGQVRVADDLPASLAAADAFAAGIRSAIDGHARKLGLPQAPADDWPTPPALQLRSLPGGELNLRAAGITSLICATGFRHDFSWINPPIASRHGFPEHRRGVTQLPGLYVLGLPWLHKWKSATLLGVGEDAQYIAEHITRRRL